MKDKPRYPGWRFGPNGEAEIFQCAEDVPEGWCDSPQAAAEPEKPTPKPRGRPRK